MCLHTENVSYLCRVVLHADYVFGERKFGGNAQAITSKRWLHHTSLLWDYDQPNMAVLTNPKKQPAYRQVSSTLQLQISFDRQIAKSCFGQSCVGYVVSEEALSHSVNSKQLTYLTSATWQCPKTKRSSRCTAT